MTKTLNRPRRPHHCATCYLSIVYRRPRVEGSRNVTWFPALLAPLRSLKMIDIPLVEDCCANCGKESSDAVKLKNCAACRLVKYCSVDCQGAHRKLHKEACKKRAAELKDERLYSQGQERPEGDFCPICTLPIPLPVKEHSVSHVCCMKSICNGCSLAVHKRGMLDCAFCRTPSPTNDADRLAMVQKRVDAKDPEAIAFLADKHYFGILGLEKDVPRAIELWTEAAKRGLIGAHHSLGIQYVQGEGVIKDKAKGFRHFELAAMKGHVEARHNLGSREYMDGNYRRAIRHWSISAKMGEKLSLEMIKKMFLGGNATKEQYAGALKGYQVATEETKSPERDEAKAYLAHRKFD